MSYVEIYGAKSTGEIVLVDEVSNAWLGAMHIWNTLSQEYNVGGGLFEGFSKLWKLADTGKLKDFENIVLKSTFDNVVTKKEDIPNLLKAFKTYAEKYPGSNLLEQAEVISTDILSDDEMIAVCWNQTSVNGNPWTEYDEELDEYSPYNILKGDRHWFLKTTTAEGDLNE